MENSWLLLEREVAEILRCSTSTVKRLRFSGALRYLVGRPVRIWRQDLDAYLRSARRGGERNPEEKRRRAEAIKQAVRGSS
ncbi:helix-turn-helix domain-containing protein [Devosia enhydra]|uniref:helix-turn-helix domain-containing protein n=1 Tax=Devosia enhydra TaxID=665118 RepID=UPI0009305E09